MFEGSDTISMQPSELNDLLMCESYFDNFTTSDMDQNAPPSPSMLQNSLATRPSHSVPTTPLSSFEAQLQALLEANAAAAPTSQPPQSSFNPFDWTLGDAINATSDFSSPELLLAMSSPESLDDGNGNMALSAASPLTFSSPSGSSPSISSLSPPPMATFNDFSMPSPPTTYRDDVLHFKTDFDSLDILDERDYYQPQIRTMSVANITTNGQQQSDYPQTLTRSAYISLTGLETPVLEPHDIPTDHNARKRRKSLPISSVATVAPVGASKRVATTRSSRASVASSPSSQRQSSEDLDEPMPAINIPATPSNELPPVVVSLLSLQKQQRQQQQQQQQQISTAQFSAAAAFNQQKTWPNGNALMGMNQDGIKLGIYLLGDFSLMCIYIYSTKSTLLPLLFYFILFFYF